MARPGSPTYSVAYSYDFGTNGIGRRTGMTDASGTTTWVYNSKGQLASESRSVTGIGQFFTQWGYNSAGLMTSMTYPGGSDGSAGEVVTYLYTPQMLLDTMTGTSNYVTDTIYDSAGRTTSRVLGNGVTQGYTYYPWNAQGGRLQGLTAGTLENFSYSYDPVGNITQIVDSVNTQTQAFTYDELDRLKTVSASGSANSGGYSETDTYDPYTGNLATKAGASYSYGDAAHKHAVTSAGSNTYTYDANGNMLTRRVSNKTITFTYDAEGHPSTGSGQAC